MRPGRDADHSPPSSAAVMEEKSYTYTHPLGHTGHVTGKLYLFLIVYKHATALEEYTFVLAHQASIQGILQIVKNSVTY